MGWLTSLALLLRAGATSQAYYGGYYAPYPPGAPSAQMYGYPQYVAEAPVADSAAREEGLAYSKQPRYVEYTPYTMEDFKGKPYNSKQQKYWELGKIGPDLETDELREKREKAERMKQYAKDAHKKNMAVSTAKPNKVNEIPLLSETNKQVTPSLKNSRCVLTRRRTLLFTG
jgi:hypothetical protein